VERFGAFVVFNWKLARSGGTVGGLHERKISMPKNCAVAIKGGLPWFVQ
jgi:hypothetical protein